MPLERMRVGINSESASHTHTPGPIAKNAMNTKRLMATSHPLCVARHGSNQRIVDFQRRLCARHRDCERIRKERDNFVGGHAALARDLNRLGGRVVGTRDLGGGAEIAIGIDDDQRCRPVADRLAGIADSAASSAFGSLLVVEQRDLLIRRRPWTGPRPGNPRAAFRPAEEQAGADERHDDAGAAHREQELASLAVHQQRRRQSSSGNSRS